jgi:hypothetical protein
VARLIDKAIIGIVENKFPWLSLSNINMVSLPLDDADQNWEWEYSAIINVPISNPGVVPLVISDSPLRNFSISMSIYTDFLKLVVSGSVKGLLIQWLQVEKKSI